MCFEPAHLLGTTFYTGPLHNLSHIIFTKVVVTFPTLQMRKLGFHEVRELLQDHNKLVCIVGTSIRPLTQKNFPLHYTHKSQLEPW